MASVWYEFGCPDCDKTNWVCDGDPSDMSGVDIEAIKCWNCGAVFDCYEMIKPDDTVAEDGQEYPT